MILHRIHLDPRGREARRDLADPYQLHATLCRAFSPPDMQCPHGEFLWRLEPETDSNGFPRVLVQSKTRPSWDRIEAPRYLASADPGVNLEERLRLNSLEPGRRFRFRLRANPSVKRDGKRLGLLHLADQEQWISRKAQQHGFALPTLPAFDLSKSDPPRVDVRISQEKMLRGRQHRGHTIRAYSVLFEGLLTVKEPAKFNEALRAGIGPGKVMGLGLLSVAPVD